VCWPRPIDCTSILITHPIQLHQSTTADIDGAMTKGSFAAIRKSSPRKSHHQSDPPSACPVESDDTGTIITSTYSQRTNDYKGYGFTVRWPQRSSPTASLRWLLPSWSMMWMLPTDSKAIFAAAACGGTAPFASDPGSSADGGSPSLAIDTTHDDNYTACCDEP